MLPEKIMQSDLLDILFENRNKNYGAYTLRKFYYQRINFAISATIFLSACMCVIMLLHHNKKIEYVTSFIIPPDAEIISIPPDKPIIPMPAHVQQVSHYRQVNTSPPIIASDDKPITMPTIADIDNSIISNVNTDGETPPNIINSPTSGSGNDQASTMRSTPVIDDNKPLISAEVMPEFPGGINALVKFIQKNVHQPDDLQAGDAIKVIASFVVSKTGTIENVKIISSGRADLAKEVMRIINKMPLWKPGLQNGKPVSVYFNLPVTFQSADE
jgi:protein TonB